MSSLVEIKLWPAMEMRISNVVHCCPQFVETFLKPASAC